MALSAMMVFGQGLDSTLEIFFNLNDSMSIGQATEKSIKGT